MTCEFMASIMKIWPIIFFLFELQIGRRRSDNWKSKTIVYRTMCKNWTDLFVEWRPINNAFNGYFIDIKWNRSTEVTKALSHPTIRDVAAAKERGRKRKKIASKYYLAMKLEELRMNAHSKKRLKVLLIFWGEHSCVTSLYQMMSNKGTFQRACIDTLQQSSTFNKSPSFDKRKLEPKTLCNFIHCVCFAGIRWQTTTTNKNHSNYFIVSRT